MTGENKIEGSKKERSMIYLDIDIRPFPSTRKDRGYYIFIDRMKEGSGNVIARNVLECNSNKDIKNTIHTFIKNYKKDYNYLRLWNNILTKKI